MSEQNGKRTVNRLERKEVLRLGHWLQSQIEGLKADATPFSQVADRAAKELGFIIGSATVREMLRDLGMHYEPRRHEIGNGKMQQAKHELRRRLERLEFAFGELCQRLGVNAVDLLNVRRDVFMEAHVAALKK